nr:MAG TPA: hypothetical protein [Bacteriophage sp.]
MVDDKEVVYNFMLTQQDLEDIMDDEDVTIYPDMAEALDYILYDRASEWIRESMDDFVAMNDDDPQ